MRVGPSSAPPSSLSLLLVAVTIASVVACCFGAAGSTVLFFCASILSYNTELAVVARDSLSQSYSAMAAIWPCSIER
jgi:hypothetical protein